METPETELPSETRFNENKRNNQLALIIHNSEKWLEFLFHEFNGLLGNINWITRLMDNKADQDELPNNTFRELNLSTQLNIYTLKEVQHYVRILNAVAENSRLKADRIILSEAILRTCIPNLSSFKVQVLGLPMDVSSAFAKVLSFLLGKILEVTKGAGLVDRSLTISFNEDDPWMLQIFISGTGLDWEVLGWMDQPEGISPAQLGGDPNEWAKQMVNEILTVTGGRRLCSREDQDCIGLTGNEFRVTTGLIQNEYGQQQLAFSLPYNLEMI